MVGYRTIIANILMAILPIMELAEFRNVLPDDLLPAYALVIVAANMILRYVTTTPIGKSA